MNCRKCGSNKTTRRRAGVFFCQHCGMQPGPTNMDRFGNPGPVHVQAETPAAGEYVIKPRRPRLLAGTMALNG